MNNTTVCKKFSEGATRGQGSHLYIEGEVLYSYGKHFPLLVRTDWGFLQNADRYSNSTSKHQSLAGRYATVLIPFSALNRANLDYQKIVFIDKVARVYEEHKYIDKDGIEQTAQERRPEAWIFKHDGKYYLSSLDNGNYFISQLPKKAQTVKEGFNLLLPKDCKQGTYKRQGEFFFLPDSDVQTKNLLAIVKHGRLRNKLQSQEAHHYATETGYTKKDVYARGTVRHTQGDHTMLKLGKVWHKVIESNHKQSWGAGGSVD